MSGIKSKASGALENSFQKFQGQQFDDDLDLGCYQFKWRNHDPQIGRFYELDPLAEKYSYNSTYAFSENKVIGHVELEGLEAVPTVGTAGLGGKFPTQGDFNDDHVVDKSERESWCGAVLLWMYEGSKMYLIGSAGINVGIPLVLSDITGLPISPSPQAFAGTGFTATSLAGNTSSKVAPMTAEGEAAAASTSETTTVFRGVNQSHAGYNNATKGIVSPRGGTASAAEHNSGNTNSQFTSWTTDPEVAKNFALRGSGTQKTSPGVVLEVTVPNYSITPSPNTSKVALIQSPGKVVSESEVLLKGLIYGAKTTIVK